MLGGRGKAFCAGADLAWMRAMADYTWEQNRADAQALAEMLWTIYSCPVPVVGRIHGDCYAGGVGLAAVCDILVAAEARASASARRGSACCRRRSGRTSCARSASRRRAATSSPPSASAPRRRRRSASCTRCAAADELDAKVAEIVAALVANGPMAVRACKKLVHDVAGAPIDAALRADTARRIADIRASDEGKEGVQSFLQKRKPSWHG